MAYVAVFGIFTDWGMSSYIVREMAEDPKRTSWLLPNAMGIRVGLSLIMTLVAPLSAYLLGKETDVVLGILLASVSLILYGIQGPLHGALTARERLDYTSTFALIGQLVFWSFGVLLLVRGMGFIGLIVASLLRVLAVGLLCGWALSRLRSGRLEFSVRRWPNLLGAALPFGVSGISFAFIDRFDTMFMSFVLSDAAVGWYNVPWTLISMILLIAQSIAIAMYPSMVRSRVEDPETLLQVVWRSMKYLLIVCLPIAAGGTILADRIILTLYEQEFVRSIPVLQITLWALPSMFLLELLGRLSSALRLEKQSARVNLINAGITVVLNLILVPTMGILGAALAFLIGRTIRLAQMWRLIGTKRLIDHRWNPLLRVVLSTASMAIVVFLLRQIPLFGPIDSKWGILALTGSGAITYVGALLVLGAVDRQEQRFIFRMVTARLREDVA
jgi:O-antigen/teichoic acid export membrane protein